MRNALLSLLAAATVCVAAARAADFPSATPERVDVYQGTVRAALTERGWRITQERAGRITAERGTNLGRYGNKEVIIGAFYNKAVRLIVNFSVDSKGQAESSARASLCYYNRSTPDGPGETAFSPVPYRDPKLTQEYRDIVAEAKGSKTDRQADPDSAGQHKVAMK